jgi:hypothetical protein
MQANAVIQDDTISLGVPKGVRQLLGGGDHIVNQADLAQVKIAA